MKLPAVVEAEAAAEVDVEEGAEETDVRHEDQQK
jgi:hypothetical protein